MIEHYISENLIEEYNVQKTKLTAIISAGCFAKLLMIANPMLGKM